MMCHYPIPENEWDRLQALESLELLYSPAEEAYTSLAELVAFITNSPAALISIVGEDVQWFKAKVGLDVKETPREQAFCAHTIVHDELMIVEDATKDERFCNNPLVTGDLHLRFYAGVPIYAPSGHPMGSVCVLDQKPRQLSEKQKNALRSIGDQVSKLLELRHKSAELKRLAQAHINLEKATIDRQIALQEEERELIGFELHENFGQRVAACLHQLSAIADLNGMQAQGIATTKQNLSELLTDIKALSRSIDPVGGIGIGAEEKLRQLLLDHKNLSGVSTNFFCAGDLDCLSLKSLVQLFCIITDQLHLYDGAADETKPVNICISVANKLQLRMWRNDDRGEGLRFDPVVVNTMRKRCERLGASYNIGSSKNSDHILVIKMPL